MPRSRSTRACAVFVLAGVIVIAASGALSAGELPGEEPLTGHQRRSLKVSTQLAAAWSACYAEEYKEGARLAAELTRFAASEYFRWAALQGAHIRARCLWAGGGRAERESAKRLWQRLGSASTLTSVQQRGRIAEALRLSAAFDPARPSRTQPDFERAIDLLEEILTENRPHTTTPEAAIDLARLYVKAGRFDDAEHTLDFAIRLMRRRGTPADMEITEDLAEVFLDAARDARRRLEYQRDAGRTEFEAAERLRRRAESASEEEIRAEKFSGALRAYRVITEKFPHSGYAPRSELAIGHCMVGLGRPDRAVRHWEEFIAPMPAGPWRAQAFISLIDIYLEERLDLERAGEYASQARAAMPTGLSEDGSSASWKQAARGLWLRIGTVDFCRGRGAEAAEAFTEAKALTRSRFLSECLEALIAAAETGRGVIPEDAGGDPSSAAGEMSRPALTLSIGMIHTLSGDYERGMEFFERAGGRLGEDGEWERRPMRGADAAEVAFTFFGKGAVLDGRGRRGEAIKHFEESLKRYPEGSWHDETLYRIATLMLRQAGADNVRDRAETIPRWRRILSDYPESLRREEALYHAAALRHDLAEHAEEAATEDILTDIAGSLGRFAEKYPESTHTGDAAVRRIAITLERLFDLEEAGEAAQQASVWADRMAEDGIEDSALMEGLSAWQRPTRGPRRRELQRVMYECYARAGLVAYLRGEQDLAAELVGKAAHLERSERRRIGAETGMERMLSIIRGGQKPLTPDELLENIRDDRQKTGLQIADMALMTFEPERAGGFYERLLRGEGFLPEPSARLESYLIFRMGQSLKFQDRREESYEYLERLYETRYSGYPWVADGISHLGTWIYNATDDAEESMKHWRHVFTRYPDLPVAEKSLYFYGAIALGHEEYEVAQRAFELYLERYPNTERAQPIRDTWLLKARNREQYGE